jgi:hypothetical protein
MQLSKNVKRGLTQTGPERFSAPQLGPMMTELCTSPESVRDANTCYICMCVATRDKDGSQTYEIPRFGKCPESVNLTLDVQV